MANFGHLKRKKKEVAEFTFWNLVGEPTVQVKHAGEKNKAYFNEMLRMAEHMHRRKKRVDAGMVAANRDKDRELFPLHVLTSWHVEGEHAVRDADGKPVPFSVENAKAFITSLDDDEFDLLRDFAKDSLNFDENALDVEAAAGNLPSA